MVSLFRLPDEVILTPLLQSFPGRDQQIRSLATLIYPAAAPCRNLVLHGAEATGKSSITSQLLARLATHLSADDDDDSGSKQGGSRFKYAIVNAAQCISGRHLFERIVGAVADSLALPPDTRLRRCETLAQLAVALAAMLKGEPAMKSDLGRRFVLALDSIDKQRDAPPTLLPALARLSELIPCLTCIFIVTAPPAGFLRTPASAHLHFPPYSKSEFVRILSLAPPSPVPGTTQQETSDLWTRFCAAVHDAFVNSASRTLPSFRHGCFALWPRFTAPILNGTYTIKEFTKLLVSARVHFQDESLLNPSIVCVSSQVLEPTSAADGGGTTLVKPTGPVSATTELSALLPIAARALLLCAYLASHNAIRHDLSLFSSYHHASRKRRRGGGITGASRGGATRFKHRKIARKLLGAHAFVLERMLAIFEAVRADWIHVTSSIGDAGIDGDVGMAIATLASLRLLTRVGAGDMMDRAGKWRINVGWEAIRSMGRSIGVEIEEWLIE
ncbi:hypothetical protein RJ55_07104 [Drechmeria coniospora]|nr:hypothetical protein RJ55_07104 [Drechmeria coniospora]